MALRLIWYGPTEREYMSDPVCGFVSKMKDTVLYQWEV